MEKIRVGVFGGFRGMTMIDVLFEHPDATLVAVCDKDDHVLDQVRQKSKEKNYPIELFRSFEDFLDYDMDAVVLANYANEHAPFAVRCLNRGLHVLSECLPCETMAQAVELIEAAEQSGKVYAYAENYCYMSHSFEMWKRYKNGDVGEVQYAEGEYIHDCTSIWPDITYGDRDHWRNRMYATFYCTHSIGPMLTITGRRPVQVVGFETNPNEQFADEMGCWRGAGIEMITLDNGAVCKSVHGDLKREPGGSINVMIYGKKGMMESKRYNEKEFNLYVEGEKFCEGDWEKYDPKNDIAPELAKKVEGHGGSDFYPTHFFLEKILGREDGRWSIDVYDAVDMGICGILAWQSVLNGNRPVAVPNLRNKEERDAWRGNNACTNKAIAGDQLLPVSSFPHEEIPDAVYEKVEQLWRTKFNR